jgi:hypothetical protein
MPAPVNGTALRAVRAADAKANVNMPDGLVNAPLRNQR